MVTSHNDDKGKTASLLPNAFEQALLRTGRSDEFSDAVNYAAELADCEFLFEIPGALIDADGGRAAVIRSRGKSVNQSQVNNRQLQKNDILYVIFNSKKGVIRIMEEFEVPASIHAMTHSYFAVLEFLADHGAIKFHQSRSKAAAAQECW